MGKRSARPAARRRGQHQPDPAVARDPLPLALPLILVLALVLRLVVFVQLKDHLLLQPGGGLDTSVYVDLARQVLGGDVALGPGLYFVSPLYIYFLAAVFAVRDSLDFARVVQAVLGTVSVGLIFVAAREWFGRRAALAAAALAAATGQFAFFEVAVLQSALDPVLTAASLAALALGLRRRSDRWGAAAGALFGAGAAIDRALTWARERRLNAWRPALALLVPLAVLCNGPLGGDDGRAEERTRMAERLITMGRYAEADEWAAKAEPIDPRPSVMHVRVGRFFLGAKQYDRALAHFERARQLEPDRAEIDYALGTALLEAGRPGDAVPHLRKALDARVSGATAAELARALAASGKRDEALAVLRQDLDAPRDAASWLAAGQVAFELQAPELAEQLVRKSLSVDPNQPGAHQQLGMALALSGRLNDAIAELTKAAEQSPRDPAVRLNLAVTYARARQFIAALDAR